MTASPTTPMEGRPSDGVFGNGDFIAVQCKHENPFSALEGETTCKSFPSHRQQEALDFISRQRDEGLLLGVSRPVPPELQHVFDDDQPGEQPRPPPNTSKRRVRGAISAIPASEIQPESPSYVIPGLVPRGAASVLAGDPSLGKSHVVADMAARISRGDMLVKQAGVLILNAEDSAPHVTRPRLEAAGADLSQVHIVEASDPVEGLSLPRDLADLRTLVRETHTGLLVVDPINSYIDSGVNSWKDTDIRRALGPLAELAKEFEIAVLLVSHLTKADSPGEAGHRVLGSVGYTGLPRAVIFLTRDPDDPDGDNGRRRVLAPETNKMGHLAQARIYEIESVTLPGGTETSRLVDRGPSEYSARELLELTRRSRPREGRTESASAFLQDELEGGEWKPVKTIRERGGAEGHAWPTVERARRDLGVESRRQGRSYEWRLPSLNGLLDSEVNDVDPSLDELPHGAFDDVD